MARRPRKGGRDPMGQPGARGDKTPWFISRASSVRAAVASLLAMLSMLSGSALAITPGLHAQRLTINGKSTGTTLWHLDSAVRIDTSSWNEGTPPGAIQRSGHVAGVLIRRAGQLVFRCRRRRRYRGCHSPGRGESLTRSRYLRRHADRRWSDKDHVGSQDSHARFHA